MISISFDVDWALDDVLLDCLDLLSTAPNIKATFLQLMQQVFYQVKIYRNMK